MNPFVYPKIKHVRKYSPRQYKRYQTYKKLLKLEFQGLCVYCRLPMTMKGNEAFGVDHYRPEKQFPALVCSYPNLFYCCNTCNSHKNKYWPPTLAQEKTEFIPNPCDHVMFDHLRYVGGKVVPRSQPGTKAEEILDLNDPESVSFREFIVETIATYQEKTNLLLKMKAEAQAKAKRSPAAATVSTLAIQQIDAELAKCAKNLVRLSGRV